MGLRPRRGPVAAPVPPHHHVLSRPGAGPARPAPPVHGGGAHAGHAAPLHPHGADPAPRGVGPLVVDRGAGRRPSGLLLPDGRHRAPALHRPHTVPAQPVAAREGAGGPRGVRSAHPSGGGTPAGRPALLPPPRPAVLRTGRGLPGPHPDPRRPGRGRAFSTPAHRCPGPRPRRGRPSAHAAGSRPRGRRSGTAGLGPGRGLRTNARRRAHGDDRSGVRRDPGQYDPGRPALRYRLEEGDRHRPGRSAPQRDHGDGPGAVAGHPAGPGARRPVLPDASGGARRPLHGRGAARHRSGGFPRRLRASDRRRGGHRGAPVAGGPRTRLRHDRQLSAFDRPGSGPGPALPAGGGRGRGRTHEALRAGGTAPPGARPDRRLPHAPLPRAGRYAGVRQVRLAGALRRDASTAPPGRRGSGLARVVGARRRPLLPGGRRGPCDRRRGSRPPCAGGRTPPLPPA